MNYKSEIPLINVTDNQVNTLDRLWLLLVKFWQFSCYYADYRASIYLKKK